MAPLKRGPKSLLKVAEAAVGVAPVIVGYQALRTVIVTEFANPAVRVPAMDRAVGAVPVRDEGTVTPTVPRKTLTKGVTLVVGRAPPSRLAGSPNVTM
jgi:hypothetical protein